jgi:outer membrane protein assembly factor BamB
MSGANMRAREPGRRAFVVRWGSLLVTLVLAGCSSKPAGSGAVDGGQDGMQGEGGPSDAGTPIGVLQHHGDGTRAGFYVDPAFTKAALPGIEPLAGFSAPVSGSVFAQPLFLQGGVVGQDALFVVTEANDVYAFHADTGQTLWKINLGTPEPKSALPTSNGQSCGTISPLGITSTPIIDLPSRSLVVCGMTMQKGVPDFIVAALSLDDGTTRWSVDLNATVKGFTSLPLMQRGALALLDGVLYVPFGGQAGGCLPFNGWVVGVPLSAPQTASGWHTGSSGGGIWAPSGVATDGTSAFVATASPDTAGLSPIWSQSNTEAILRIGQGAVFSGASADYFAPRDWFSYGINGSQLGAAGVVLLDMPGSSPSQLALAIGKTSDAYLVDRTNLGGIGQEVSHLESATSDWAEGAMAAYSSAAGGYVAMTAPAAFCPNYSDLTTLKVVPGSPPTLAPGWCAVQGGAGSPIATASAAASGGQAAQDVVVWGLGTGNQGTSGDGKLRAFDGDTGTVLAVAPTKMPDLEHWISPIVANGRIYVVGDKHVYAFDLGGPMHPAPQESQDAGPDTGPPLSCLLPITPDQQDPCAPYGLACLGPLQQVIGKCGTPTQGSECSAQVGCAAGLKCVTLPGHKAATCEQPCASPGDCGSIFQTCGAFDGGTSYCVSSTCGPSVDAGPYYSACDAGAGGGTCVPFYAADGTQTGACMAAQQDAGAGGCVLSRGAGPLCPEGTFCFTGTGSAQCLPLCDYTRATFGVDAGGPSCGPGQTCVLLGGNVPFGACAPDCGADGGGCPAPLTCQLWNPYTNPNQSACLP